MSDKQWELDLQIEQPGVEMPRISKVPVQGVLDFGSMYYNVPRGGQIHTFVVAVPVSYKVNKRRVDYNCGDCANSENSSACLLADEKLLYKVPVKDVDAIKFWDACKKHRGGCNWFVHKPRRR